MVFQKNNYPTKNTMLFLGVVAMASSVTNIGAELVVPAPKYTLADFDLDTVEPGLTLLSESYPTTPFAFPSKTHVTSHQTVSKNDFPTTIGSWTWGSWEPTVGVFHYADTATGEDCNPTYDKTGYIVGHLSAKGCSFEQVQRAQKAKGAIGVLSMSGLPLAGWASTAWSFGDTSDIINFPAQDVGVYTRIYLLTEFAAGNETVIALKSGDEHLWIKRANEWDVVLLMQFGALTSLITGVYGVYVRKLMYDQAPAKKKWQRTVASTCIEIEIFIALFRFIYFEDSSIKHICDLFWQYLPFQWTLDLSNLTSFLLVIYWNGITGNKSMSSNNGAFLSKKNTLLLIGVTIPILIVTFLRSWMVIIHNARFLEGLGIKIELSQLYNGYHFTVSAIFIMLYAHAGVKFFMYIRSSSKAARSESSRSTKMLKNMLAMMILSGLGILLYCANQYYYTYVLQGMMYKYFQPFGLAIPVLWALLFLQVTSIVQVAAFAAPVLRKHAIKKEEATEVSGASSTSSSAASSSAASSSAASSSHGAGSSSM
jgi:hypothetical protein